MSHGSVPADNSVVINKQLYTCSAATQSLLPGTARRLNPFPESLACWRAPKLPVVPGPQQQAVFSVVFSVAPDLSVCPCTQHCWLSLSSRPELFAQLGWVAELILPSL